MNDGSAFAVTVHSDRTSVRVAASGELDGASRGVLAAQLDDLWKLGWTDVIADLRGLTFMDSSGVHLLVEHHRRALETGARFSIIDGPAPVARVLELCGVDDVLVSIPPRAA